MAVCTIDNEATMARECWQDGLMICSYPARVICSNDWPPPAHCFFMGANIGPWQPGQIIGDIAAQSGGGGG